MKFLVLFVCVVAGASAHIVYEAKLEHLPIINHEGVPVDTAEVQHARAAHLAHKINVAARNGDHAIITAPVAHAAPIISVTTPAETTVVAHSSSVVHTAPIVAHAHTSLVAPVEHHSAVVAHSSVIAHPSPLAHYTEYSPFLTYPSHSLLYRKRRGLYYETYAPVHGYHGPQHLPIINHEGVPVDTAEVQIARAAHLAHKHNVAARNGDHHVVAQHILAQHVVAPIVHSAPHVYAHYY